MPNTKIYAHAIDPQAAPVLISGSDSVSNRRHTECSKINNLRGIASASRLHRFRKTMNQHTTIQGFDSLHPLIPSTCKYTVFPSESAADRTAPGRGIGPIGAQNSHRFGGVA